MPDLLATLADWKPFTALVVGDFMLDQIILGDAERLTGDAPVPVLHVRETTSTPGGAANVCMNLAAMRARVIAFGVVGEDAAGRTLRETLRAQKIDTAALLTDASRPTTLKQNLIGRAQQRHPQKMFRVDHESRTPLSEELAKQLLAAFDAALPTADIVAIEDYDKGVLSPDLCRTLIEHCRAAGKEVIVDPARLTDYSRYRGATCITPNRTEAEAATGLPTHPSADMHHNAELAQALQHAGQFHAVVLTLDRHGALLLENNAKPITVATVAREVYDVTGAGDMVLAALAAARANGVAWPDAVRFANTAAGLEVEIFGVQPIPLERIRRELSTTARGIKAKLYSRDEIRSEVDHRRERGQRIVVTNGCFDVLHSGHVQLIEEAKREGHFLIVAINDDAAVRAYKGVNRPVHSQDDRATVLCGLAAVDAVVIYSEDTPVDLLREIQPDVLVKGAEYSIDQIPGASMVLQYGGKVVRVPMKPGLSTTAALEKTGDPRAGVLVEERSRFLNDESLP